MFLVMTNRFGLDLPPDRVRWAAAESVSEDVIAAVLLLHECSVEEIVPQLSPLELEKVIELVGRSPRLYLRGILEALEQSKGLTALAPMPQSVPPNPAVKEEARPSARACHPPRSEAQPSSRTGPDGQQSPTELAKRVEPPWAPQEPKARPRRKSRWVSARYTWLPLAERSRHSSAFRPCSIRRSSCRIWPSAISACSRPTLTSRDFKLHKPEDVIKSVMNQLEKHGKGIILMHDFKRHTADALPELLRQLKVGGFKVVHMVPKGEVTTVPKYDEMLAHEDKLSTNNTRPETSVIRTIGE